MGDAAETDLRAVREHKGGGDTRYISNYPRPLVSQGRSDNFCGPLSRGLNFGLLVMQKLATPMVNIKMVSPMGTLCIVFERSLGTRDISYQ